MKLKSLMHPSLRRATQVLNMVNVDPKHKSLVSVKAFANGREQGYHIQVHSAWGDDNPDCLNLWFAENRNSDEMVMYFGNGYNDVPTEIMWKSRKYFNSLESLAIEIESQISGYLARKVA